MLMADCICQAGTHHLQFPPVYEQAFAPEGLHSVFTPDVGRSQVVLHLAGNHGGNVRINGSATMRTLIAHGVMLPASRLTLPTLAQLRAESRRDNSRKHMQNFSTCHIRHFVSGTDRNQSGMCPGNGGAGPGTAQPGGRLSSSSSVSTPADWHLHIITHTANRRVVDIHQYCPAFISCTY